MDRRQPCDGEWIRAVVDRFEGPLTRYAARIMRDVEAARDVVQETLLRLCDEPRQGVEDHLAEWLYTVCRHRALDVRRKEDRMRPMTDRPSALPAPPDVLEARESTRRLAVALAGLPARQQEVIRLKFQEGLSYKEIGGVMNLSISNVGVLIHTGLKTIRGQLAAGGGNQR